MRLLIAFLLMLLIWSAEPRRGPQAKAGVGGKRGRVRGRGRAGLTRRQTQQCKEYTEGGEKYLDCQDRQLTSVMQDWPRDVNHLLLARNKFQVLRNNMFAQFTQLRSLDLQQNAISMLEDGAFNGLFQLTTLLLQHNSLKTASEEVLLPLPSLTYLRLYDNPWSCRCPLDSLVRTLQVPTNRNLGPFAKCAEPPSLKDQKLKKLMVDLCADDRTPVTGDKPLPSPSPVTKRPGATSMCHTYVYPRITLNCKNKDLNRIPSELPADIVTMDLSENSIKHLRPKLFLQSKDLKFLNLSSNNLQHIDIGAFAGLLYLQNLDLSNNSLHYFRYGILEDLYFLKTLSLDNNPWICDYDIHYLIYWLKHHPGVSYTGLICTEPQEFRGWRVEDYVKTYNGECPKDKQTEGMDTGQESQGELENEAQEVMGEMGEGQGEFLPQPLRKKGSNAFEIIRLS
ncbi:leucine-rich repeat-containing protein 17 [Menidia menidia]